MSILIDETAPVLVQGMTGDKGTFHAKEMIAYGTNVVGGVTPGKGGGKHLDRPLFNTMKEAVKATGATISITFVAPAFCADAIMEAADAGIGLICSITDGIPAQDMMRVKRYLMRGAASYYWPRHLGAHPEEINVGSRWSKTGADRSRRPKWNESKPYPREELGVPLFS